jgi:hypothetical protein
MIKKIMDTVEYKYEGDKNMLILKKRLNSIKESGSGLYSSKLS